MVSLRERKRTTKTPGTRAGHLGHWVQVEEGVERRSEQHLASDTKTRVLTDALSIAVQLISEECVKHPTTRPCTHTEDEHSILYLGTQIFNNTIASWRLLLRGYYSPSLSVQRSVVESILLLQRFALEPNQVSRWRASDRNMRLNKFGPSKNRRVLQTAGEPDLYWRFEQYCELGAHPTPAGRGLTSIDGRYWTGPHFNPKLLAEVASHIAFHATFASDVLFSFSFITNSREEEREKMRSLLDEGVGFARGAGEKEGGSDDNRTVA